jgi:hypothetical protein
MQWVCPVQHWRPPDHDVAIWQSAALQMAICLTAAGDRAERGGVRQCFLNQRWNSPLRFQEVPDELQSFRATGSASTLRFFRYKSGVIFNFTSRLQVPRYQ